MRQVVELVNVATSGVMTTVKGTLNVDEAVTLDTTLDVSGAVTGGSITDGTAALSSGALSGATNVTASGTVQAEQLTSTDDALISDDLVVGNNVTAYGATAYTEVYGWMQINLL